MADLIGFTQCNRQGCELAAEFKKDKRGKYFMNCPKHGRDPASTNEAQAAMAAIIEAGLVFESVADFETAQGVEVKAPPPVQECQSIDDLRDALRAEGFEVTTSEDVLAEISETKPEKSKSKAAGVVALFVGLIVTGGYLWKAKTQQQ